MQRCKHGLRSHHACDICKAEDRKASAYKHYHRNADARREYARKRRADIRARLLAAYGNVCSCCGETEQAFLTLEHKNRDGKAHRISLNKQSQNTYSTEVYRDLEKKGYPKDAYTLMCFNCNHASWKLGVCPHQTKKVVAA